MKTKISRFWPTGLPWIGMLLTVISLTGCTPAQSNSLLPDNLVFIESSAAEQPTWIETPPPEDGDNLYFVGYSNYRATEQEAREEALLVARRRFAEFAGVEVSLLEEFEQATEGKASGVLDANVSALSRVSQMATATVSRLTIRQWYWERYRSTGAWRSKGAAFRCWALVSAPKDELFRIQAKQEIQPGENTVGEQPVIHLRIKAGIRNDHTFYAGENIPLNVSADHDCYLLLIYQDAAGNLVQLLPNRRSPEGFFSAGEAVRIPGNNDDFAFTVTEPYGRESFWAFAATRPFPELPGRNRQDGIRLLRNDIDWILNRLRVHGKNPGTLYGEARTMITTAPQTNMTGNRPRNNEEEV